MLKTTSAVGGLAIAATTIGILLTGPPASAQAPAWHGHHRWSAHHYHYSRNRNRNVNVNRVIVRVHVANRNNNVAVARNTGFGQRRFFNRGIGDGCCSRRFDGDGFIGDGFLGDGFLGGRRGFDDDGATAVIRGRDTFARAGDARAFVD